MKKKFICGMIITYIVLNVLGCSKSNNVESEVNNSSKSKNIESNVSNESKINSNSVENNVSNN